MKWDWRHWVSPFFPSWKFFEELGPEPVVFLRWSAEELDLASSEWTELWPLQDSMRGWKKLLINAESNERYYRLSVVERWVHAPDSLIHQARVTELLDREMSTILRKQQKNQAFWEAEIRVDLETWARIPVRRWSGRA